MRTIDADRYNDFHTAATQDILDHMTARDILSVPGVLDFLAAWDPAIFLDDDDIRDWLLSNPTIAADIESLTRDYIDEHYHPEAAVRY